jgi:hypothetical protein
MSLQTVAHMEELKVEQDVFSKSSSPFITILHSTPLALAAMPCGRSHASTAYKRNYCVPNAVCRNTRQCPRIGLSFGTWRRNFSKKPTSAESWSTLLWPSAPTMVIDVLIWTQCSPSCWWIQTGFMPPWLHSVDAPQVMGNAAPQNSSNCCER